MTDDKAIVRTARQRNYWIETKSAQVCPRCEWKDIAEGLSEGRPGTGPMRGIRARMKMRRAGWYLTIHTATNSGPVFRKPCDEHEEMLRKADDRVRKWWGGY